VKRAAKLELISIGCEGDISERSIGGRYRVEEDRNVPDVGMNDSLLDVEDERFRIVERRMDTRIGSQHLSANPENINPKVRTLTEHEIVCVDQRWGVLYLEGIGCTGRSGSN
jgi:5,10-methenyltetrahydromethanopterin hydrogenase